MTTQQLIKNAVNTLVDSVKVTLGVKGRTVLYNTEENKPHITKDGVSVARHIASDNNYENMIMTVLREASVKTMLNSGDGTTTTLVLSQYLINEGLKLMEEGISYYEISKGFDSMKDKIMEAIRSISVSVDGNEELLKHVASIASNDEKVGEFIYNIIKEIGIYGDIQVRASQLSETKVDKTKGMKLHKGYFEGFMVNNTKDMTFTAKNAAILLYNDVIHSFNDISMYLQVALQRKQSLVIFCDDISDITLKQIKSFMEANPVPLCFVENDGFRDKKEILLNDLAALVGGYIVNASSQFDPENLGLASEIKVEELYTSIVGGNTDEELVEEIVQSIKTQLEIDDIHDDLYLTNVDKKWYRKRLANLTGGVAVIYAGGNTEMEMRELKDRLDDAVLAVYSAIKEGVCPGGGYALVNIQNSLKADNRVEQLLLDSLSYPFKQLLINSDLYKEHDTIFKGLLEKKGYDLRKESFEDINSYNVYDSVGVLLDAINNSVAVSKSILSIKKLVFDGLVYNG